MYKFCFGLLCGALICGLLVVPGMTQQAEQLEIGGVPLQIGMAKDLRVHCKTGHTGSLQNRP